MAVLRLLPLFLFLLPLLYSTEISGPPKLLVQPPEEVWFQPLQEDEAAETRLTLKCQASPNAESFEWRKNGESLPIEGDLEWVKPGQSGTIIFRNPKESDEGYYQCFVSNVFGTAVTNQVHVRLGVLEHFVPRPVRTVEVDEGESLTLECKPPFGIPAPTVFWLYRDSEQDSVIETIKREHIAVDGEGRLHFAHVQAHDGRKTLIYECAATSPVLQGEYRAGDEVQVRVRPSPRPKTSAPHKLWFSSEEVTVKAGGKLKLQCIFGGRPTPKISWSKKDGELPKQRMKELTSSEADFGKSLLLENIHPEDAGLYECRAGDVSHVMNVRVLAAPYWDFEPPRDVEQSEESTTELECLASGSPPPIIQWAMNGKALHELPENNRRLLLDGGRLLRLVDLNHDVDTAVYQCNASNPLGYVFANAFVNVKAHAPRFTMSDKRVWKVVLRSTLLLNCDVEAAPEAVVRWVDADDRPIQLVPGKIKLYANHTLEITDVSTADEGLYYCNVSNKYGLNRALNKLQVYKPTYFVKIPSPKRLTVEAGEVVELACEAVSDPRLDIDYRWTLNGRRINESKVYEFVAERLRMIGVKGRHSGIVDCAAVTDVDVKVASMQLIVMDVPEKPTIEAIECTERKATVKWLRANDHGDKITRYVLEMETDFVKGKWEKLVEETDVDRERFSADITLTPWLNCTFRVTAINSHGKSEAGMTRGISCSTRPSIPYTNPSGVVGAGTKPDNLVIRWKPLEKYHWNAPGLQFLVRYKLNTPDAAWTEFLVEDPWMNHTIIRDQPTFKQYLIQVRSVNSIGPSILEPETIIGWSGEDVPSAAPTDFLVREFHNYTAISFSWTPVEAASVNGHFKGYEIEYWPLAKPQKISKALADSKQSAAVVMGLAANSNYSARIRTRNAAYRSAPSEIITFETPEGIPSKVHNLRVYSVGAQAILILWEPPKEPNGVIRGYFLTFDSDRNVTEETYVLHRQNAYLHEKATPDSGYRVSVWAETNAGEGPRSMRAIRTHPLRDPDVPVFVVENVTMSSMDIRWIPSNDSLWRMPGSSFFVNYSLTEEASFIPSTIVFLPFTTIRISGLEESSQYTLVGAAKDGSRLSYSQPVFVSTLSSEEAAQLNQESLRNAAWFIAVVVAATVALVTVGIMCCCEQRRSGRYLVKKRELEIGHQIDKDEEKHFLEYQYGIKS